MSTTAKIRTPRFISGLTGVCMMLASCHAWSWGHTGHVEISRIAIDKLPEEIPFFVRNDLAMAAIGELGPEADESKTTGIVTGVSSTGSLLTTRTVHDAERDPGHFIDIDDAGVVIGGVVPLTALPTTRDLAETLAQVGPTYQAALDSGNDNYQTAKPAEVAIVTARLAAGAAELRDEIVDAWRQSATITVGFPLVSVADILAGRVTVTPVTFGAD